MSGMHRSPYYGQSIEFREHREYVAGDDLRHVDWKVWGKQDRFVVKRYEEDTNLRCTLVVDASASMQVGNGALTKRDYAATAAAAFAYLLLNQHDSVGCTVFDDRIRHELPQRTQRNHLNAIVQALSDAPAQDKTNVGQVLARVAQQNPRKGVIILLSDLLSDVESTLAGLITLRRIGHDVVVLHILDDEELDFTFRGPVRFEGLEDDVRLDCNPKSLRQGYLEAVERFLTQVRRGCRRNAVDYQLVRTSEPLDVALTEVIARRLFSQRSKR
jgi:uncharacterized protein (DUF58 family)